MINRSSEKFHKHLLHFLHGIRVVSSIHFSFTHHLQWEILHHPPTILEPVLHQQHLLWTPVTPIIFTPLILLE